MESFNAILGSLSKFAPLMSAGTGLMGMVNQFSLASKEKAAMDRAAYYAKHPEAISAIAEKLQQPLSQGLVKGTENIVNASMAEQGLSQAPGIQSQVLSQALAPYQQNAQQMALTAALQAIGLPMDALKAIQSSMRPDQLAMMLKGILPGGDSGGSPTSYPYPSIPTGEPGITFPPDETPPQGPFPGSVPGGG